MQRITKTIRNFAGINGNKTTHVEKLVSGLGGFCGILLILIITRHFVAPGNTVLIVASMGASAVLLFAVPHGPLSQPWALVGGHLISACIGVSCYIVISNPFVAAACAVGIAITAMYYLRCIHPPGGATALTTVVAGTQVHALGYTYILIPVLLNVLVILSVAIIFNNFFSWRRYPTALMQFGRKQENDATQKEKELSTADLEFALQQMNMYVDVSNDDLDKIYQLAKSRTEKQIEEQHIKLGHYYSNGEYSGAWSVRQVVDEANDPRPDKDMVIYKVVAGSGRRSSGTMTREEFARWSKYEVFLNESSWQRVDPMTEFASVA